MSQNPVSLRSTDVEIRRYTPTLHRCPRTQCDGGVWSQPYVLQGMRRIKQKLKATLEVIQLMTPNKFFKIGNLYII
jgi:hypothetical protein